LKKQIICQDKIKLHFCCYGDPLPDFAALARRFNLENVVVTTGPVSQLQSLSLQRSADVLLYWDWTSDMGVTSAKLFEYLAAGRNILALVHPDGPTAQVVRETGAGKVASSDQEIEQVLVHWYKEFEKTGRIIYRGEPSRIAAHSFPKRAESYDILLDGILQGNGL
jgi:hypothetical protein